MHKNPVVGMQTFVYKQIQFHEVQSEQVTLLHFKLKIMDANGDALPEAPSLEGCAETGIPFK